MANTVKLIPTGFSFIDKNWGGIYQGGSYVVVGSKKSGKSLFALKFLKESVETGKCLYFSDLRPKDLFIQASTIDFDLRSKLEDNKVTLVRVLPVPYDLDENKIDEYLAEYLNDIYDLVKQYNPKYLIFDELTEFIEYKNVRYLQQKFIKVLEAFEEFDITSLFLINEPTDSKTDEIVKTLDNYSTGLIQFKNIEETHKSELIYGEVTIKPNVGHLQGQFIGEYLISPDKGLVVRPALEDSMGEQKSFSGKRVKVIQSGEKSDAPDEENKTEKKNSSIKDKPANRKEEFSFSNIYEYTDFLLILNTHIALYKSTAQSYHLVCFQIDPEVSLSTGITAEQLKNIVTSATDRKDKICFVHNKVFVLVVRSSANALNTLTERVYALLRDSKRNYNGEILNHIKALVVESETDMENSEVIMNYIFSEEGSSQTKFYPLKSYLG